MDWILSDLHNGHANILKYSNRPFSSLEEMSETFVKNINSRVQKTDRLIIAGDCQMGQNPGPNFVKFREQLNCSNIILVEGNHDSSLLKYLKNNNIKIFESIHKIWEGKFDGRFMVVCHYAMKTWLHQSKGQAYHCFGHSHFSLPDDPSSLSMDIGVDGFYEGIHERFFPYCLDEIEKVMKLKTYVKIDHH